jgi:hypothetical protein
VRSRGLFQCNACHRQTSPIAGTIFASTHLPLGVWFRAMDHLTQSKQGISSIELGRRLGVTQTTAWKIKHKLAQAMMERDAAKPLNDRVELGDAYLGGERSGGKRGRGAPGKTPFVAAVETIPEGKPARGVRTRSPRPALALPLPLPLPLPLRVPRRSNGSIPRWGISKPPLSEPTARSIRSTCRATSLNSSIGSIGDTISQQ